MLDTWAPQAVIEWDSSGDLAGDRMWTALAKCKTVDPDVMFPTDGIGVRRAQAICAGCPVRDDCLEYALVHNEDHGVWGGASERRRRQIRRERAAIRRRG